MTTININTNMAAASVSPAVPTSSPAFESTLTSYASRILKIKSPSTASIDPSVGPYVTSVLRSALGDCDTSSASVEGSDFLQVTIPEEYDALMELMMEQCEMQREGASSALHSIAKAIQTGQFEDLPLFSFDLSGNQQLPRSRSVHVGAGSNMSHRRGTMVGNGIGMGIGGGIGNGFSTGMGMGGYRSKFRSKSMGAEHDYGEEETINFLGEMLERSGTTLPSWSVGLQHDESDSPGNSHGGRGAAGGVIIEEDEDPSFHFEEDEAPMSSTPNKDDETCVESPSALTSMLTTNDSANTPRPAPAPATGSNNKEENFMLEGFSPFWTADEKRVVEELKNLPAPNFSFTPLKPDRLIPVDLLGVIDDPFTPANDLKSVVEMAGNDKKMGIRTRTDSDTGHVFSPSVVEETTSLSTPTPKVKPMAPLQGNEDGVVTMIARNAISSPLAPSHISKNTTTQIDIPQAQALGPTKLSSGKGKKNKKKKDNDLAAALFTRPRARSMQCYHEEKSPKLKPMAPPPVSQIGMSNLSCSAAAVMNNSIPALFKKQLDSAVEILLAMNYDVCRDAAYEAALVSNADVNIAQHVIDGALAAPPVCRHMLNDGCYRSDCHFSHDVDGHTCLFWLRGRCGKGDSGCRFMHGFSEKLLDGVNLDARKRTPNKESRSSSAGAFFLPPSQGLSSTSASKPIPVRTANLVQHNMKTSFSLSSSFERKTFLAPPTPQNPSADVSETHPNNLLSGVSRASPDTSHNAPKLSAQTQKNDKTGGILSPPASTPTQMQQKRNIPTPTFSFASIASKGYSRKKSFNNSAMKIGNINKPLNDSSNEKKTVRIPQNLWTSTHHRSSTAFHISDPLARFREVNSSQKDDVLDLHFQSVKTFPLVLANILPEKLRRNGEVWVITGSGHHVHRGSHQKTGGVLETAVIGWLVSNEYTFVKGKDKNGYGGAVLVQTSR